jgi:hypothetical protein
MDYEEEIKRLRRLNMKMYMTMANIITILNQEENSIVSFLHISISDCPVFLFEYILAFVL